jgi:adenylosuccinate lyase
MPSLTAISPIDGRYQHQTATLQNYFSEFALIKYRVVVEIAYLLFLADKKFLKITPKQKLQIQQIADDFTLEHAEAIKAIEKTTNHDVKAVEYFIKQQLETLQLGHIKEWVHFALTSQDVNNTAIPLSWKHCLEYEMLPAWVNLRNGLYALAVQWMQVPMLAKTHGQPASPTLLGKELMVFVERLDNQLNLLLHIPYAAKFGGATGNFNAHHVAYPKKDWVALANEFVEQRLELSRMQFTTQIEHYDMLAAHCDAIKRINVVLLDLCKDVWQYISMDYFKQKTKAGEVGSSAMPHKVNPIDFENAEGNLGVANALFIHFGEKLPISRLQRDLTDSTVLRNLGVPVGHSFLALKSIEKGLQKLILNEAKIQADLENNWAVVAEAIQTILRRENYPNPYETLKDLTRGQAAIDKKTIHSFVNKLKISAELKATLKAITPQNYTGVVAKY